MHALLYSAAADYPMHGQGTGMKESPSALSCCHSCPETANGEGGLWRYAGAIRSDVLRSMKDVVETANQLEELRGNEQHTAASKLSMETGVNGHSPFTPLGYFNLIDNMPHEPTHVLLIGTIGGVCIDSKLLSDLPALPGIQEIRVYCRTEEENRAGHGHCGSVPPFQCAEAPELQD